MLFKPALTALESVVLAAVPIDTTFSFMPEKVRFLPDLEFVKYFTPVSFPTFSIIPEKEV